MRISPDAAGSLQKFLLPDEDGTVTHDFKQYQHTVSQLQRRQTVHQVKLQDVLLDNNGLTISRGFRFTLAAYDGLCRTLRLGYLKYHMASLLQQSHKDAIMVAMQTHNLAVQLAADRRLQLLRLLVDPATGTVIGVSSKATSEFLWQDDTVRQRQWAKEHKATFVQGIIRPGYGGLSVFASRRFSACRNIRVGYAFVTVRKSVTRSGVRAAYCRDDGAVAVPYAFGRSRLSEVVQNIADCKVLLRKKWSSLESVLAAAEQQPVTAVDVSDRQRHIYEMRRLAASYSSARLAISRGHAKTALQRLVQSDTVQFPTEKILRSRLSEASMLDLLSNTMDCQLHSKIAQDAIAFAMLAGRCLC